MGLEVSIVILLENGLGELLSIVRLFVCQNNRLDPQLCGAFAGCLQLRLSDCGIKKIQVGRHECFAPR